MNLRHLLLSGSVGFMLACGQLAGDPGPAQSPPDDAPPSPADAPTDGECNGQPCKPPDQCVRYVGVGGPSVPLYTCGIPCGPAGECPESMTCRVIPDGPRLCKASPPPP